MPDKSTKPEYHKLDAVKIEKQATEVQKDTVVRLEASRASQLAELADLERGYKKKRRPVEAALQHTESELWRLLESIDTGQGSLYDTEPCPDCKGKGKIGKKTCTLCKGTGEIPCSPSSSPPA